LYKKLIYYEKGIIIVGMGKGLSLGIAKNLEPKVMKWA